MRRFNSPLALAAMLGAIMPAFWDGASAQARDASASQATLARGRSVYAVKGCYQCHGYAGQGSVLSGPALAGRRFTAERIKTYTRAPIGIMPPYRREILSDADLDAVTAYVLRFPVGRPARDIPLLRRQALAGLAPAGATTTGTPAGGVLYARQCAACHGADRSGGSGADLRPLTGAAGMAAVIRAVRQPPDGMPRLTPDPLSDAEVRAIAAHVAQVPSGN